MYLITYQKRNGTIFCRIRNTIPNYTDGKTTSMGWKILDVKQRYKDNFYSFNDCYTLEKKARRKYHIIKNIRKFLSKYSFIILQLIIILFLIK